MERYTAFLEAYSWITLSALFLGGVLALATTSAEKRRYPVLFGRRRALLTPLLLILAVLSMLTAVFLPGAEEFPKPLPLALYFLPLTALSMLLFRFPRSVLPVVVLVTGALVWYEKEVTAAYAYPDQKAPFLFVDLRQVDAGSLELYVETPAAGTAMVPVEGERAFAFRAEGTTLSVAGETIEHHPYLWWRPRWGVTVDSIGGNDSVFGGTMSPGDVWAARYLSILQRLGGLRRERWSVEILEEELLLGRYTASMEEGEVTFERRRLSDVVVTGLNQPAAE